ncbi:cytochrome P450 [Kutzneria sp. 744]|uniref:cytochrome P450 n=1 Tax=Kutzneria sp. (strain 744) TaxID=345341 RepID=UPI0003EEA3EF|nr:cytochrome P450 [Kutzneria sp. 744]EWM19759.1 cytochrome P450 enzyme cypA [Kutzneria sp. 744]
MTGEAPRYPFGPATGLDQHPGYRRLRGAGPVRVTMPYGGEAWLVTDYHDTKVVLGDQRFSRAEAAGRDTPRSRPPMDSPDQILSMDPPRHTRLRKLVAQAFTTRRIEQMRSRIQTLVDGLLDTMISAGPPADLAEGLAWPLPASVICELLGVPGDDHETFRAWTEATLALGEDGSVDPVTARDNLNTYLSDLIAERRSRPTDDLLSALVSARDHGDKLSEEELVRLGVTLLISGHETTANQIGNMAFVLLAEPDRWETLVAGGPSMIPGAVEELLRYIPMSAAADFARIARTDIELGGQHIAAGDAVLVQVCAANRDPEVFADPDSLVLDRSPNPHVIFGHGAHHCLGAQLARLELRTTLASLVTRFPQLRLAVEPEQIEWRTDRLVRGVRALPVIW